jgi:hypothetical protein
MGHHSCDSDDKDYGVCIYCKTSIPSGNSIHGVCKKMGDLIGWDGKSELSYEERVLADKTYIRMGKLYDEFRMVFPSWASGDWHIVMQMNEDFIKDSITRMKKLMREVDVHLRSKNKRSTKTRA